MKITTIQLEAFFNTYIIWFIHYSFIILFAVGGAGIIAISLIWIDFLNPYKVGLSDVMVYPIFGLVGVGCWLILLSFVGSLGACLQNHVVVMIYSVNLGALFIVQVTLAMLVITFGTHPLELVRKEMYDAVEKCIVGSERYKFLAMMQHNYTCCAVNSVDDYARSACYDLGMKCVEVSRGCSPILTHFVIDHSRKVGGVALIVGAFEAVGSIIGCLVAATIKKVGK